MDGPREPLLAAMPFEPTWPSILVFVALGAVILAGIRSILSIKREEREETPTTDADLLAQFEEARASGEMDEEEYRRVVSVLKGERPARPPGRPEADDDPTPAGGPGSIPSGDIPDQEPGAA